jgi:glutamate racemase
VSSIKTPIGIFDSGYGGLTILADIRKKMPQYDYLYLGDNARAPYGPRSFELVYDFTLQAVKELFSQGCELVIIACNTSSAKALRTIQQKDLPQISEEKRVLGMIRPSAEVIGELSKSGHIGILATEGTVKSESYPIEISKFFPNAFVSQHACPMWVPLIENGKHTTEAGKMIVKEDVQQLLEKDPLIDVIILGCTHYPIVQDLIESFVPRSINVIAQGPIVADKLSIYLEQHPDLQRKCSKEGTIRFLTTESNRVFDENASVLLGWRVRSEHIHI